MTDVNIIAYFRKPLPRKGAHHNTHCADNAVVSYAFSIDIQTHTACCKLRAISDGYTSGYLDRKKPSVQKLKYARHQWDFMHIAPTRHFINT